MIGSYWQWERGYLAGLHLDPEHSQITRDSKIITLSLARFSRRNIAKIEVATIL